MQHSANEFMREWAIERFGNQSFVDPAARFLGINESTMHRWVTGKQPLGWESKYVLAAQEDLKALKKIREILK